MRNTEDVTDTSSISDLQRNNKAINSANAISDLDPLIPRSDEDVAKAAKRKKIMYFGLGALGAVAVILAIVLPLALRKHDDPRPDPIGPNPLPAGIMNPYQTVMQRSS